MSGEAGWWASPLRGLLAALSIPYRTAVWIRNRQYDRPSAVVRVPVPVISIGNLTAGGTGKTPLVMEVAARLVSRGCSPAVIARGYRAADGQPNDEEMLIRRHCPAAAYVAAPNRAAAARDAVARCHADVLILDDAFQHRRLVRDLDLVLIDATCPFGYEHLLPRGLLREPRSALRRAHAIIITRSDQVAAADLTMLQDELARLAPEAALLCCVHRVTVVTDLAGTPQSRPEPGARIVAFAGIGNPEAFLTTLRAMEVEVAATRWFRDHHAYTMRDVASLVAIRHRYRADYLLTTEKDAVKLGVVTGEEGPRFRVVCIRIDFAPAHDTMLNQLLARCVPTATRDDRR